jgi:hypothetical protein
VHVLITFLVTISLTLATLLTLGTDLLVTFGDVTEAWGDLEARTEQTADTKIAGPIGLSVSATSTVQITIANEGGVALGEFARWDVIFEIQQSPGMGIAYLAYTEDASPGSNQWTVKGVYLDASAQTPEFVDPGILNPGEEMIVLANPSPSVTQNTYDRATFTTPNGVTTKVIFKVVN